MGALADFVTALNADVVAALAPAARASAAEMTVSGAASLTAAFGGFPHAVRGHTSVRPCSCTMRRFHCSISSWRGSSPHAKRRPVLASQAKHATK